MSIENNYNNDAGNEFDANGPGNLPADFQPVSDQGRREELGAASPSIGEANQQFEGDATKFEVVDGVGELSQDGIDATAMNADLLTKLAEKHGDISTWPKEEQVKAKVGFLATTFSGMMKGIRNVAAPIALATLSSTAHAGNLDINQMTQIGIQAANQEAQLRMQESNQLRQIESQKQTSLMQIDNSTRTQLMQIEQQINQTMTNPQIPAEQKDRIVQQLRSQQEQTRVNGENMKQSLIIQIESSKQQTAASLQAAREQTRNNAKASIIQNALSNLLRR